MRHPTVIKWAVELEKAGEPGRWEEVHTEWFDTSDDAKEWARLNLPYETRNVRVKAVASIGPLPDGH